MGLKKLQFTQGGSLCPPPGNDWRDHFWGQIDLWSNKYVKLDLEVVGKNWNVKGFWDIDNFCYKMFINRMKSPKSKEF